VETFARDGFVFNVEDRGPIGAEAIVLLHGFPENRTCWDGVVPSLVDAGYRTLAPDQRGYSPGARPREPEEYVMEQLVGDVLALADQAGIDRFHVVGHDWGGAVAWAVAGEHPDRVHTLTVLSTPHPRAFRRALVSSDQAVRSRYMAFFQLRGTAEKALLQDDGRRFVGGMAKAGLDRGVARAYFEFLREPDAMTCALNWYRAIRVRPRADVPAVTVPTLYVWSTEDTALGREAAELTARHVKGPYRFEVLEGISHWIPEEVPETVAGLLLDHVRSATG